MDVKGVDGPAYQSGVIVNRDFDASLYSISPSPTPSGAVRPAAHRRFGEPGQLDGRGGRRRDRRGTRGERPGGAQGRVRARAEARRRASAGVDVPERVLYTAYRKNITGIEMFGDACCRTGWAGRAEPAGPAARVRGRPASGAPRRAVRCRAR
ncbi:hypothetical protein ACU686_23185 [Yinghuangia aomiensis]